MERRGRGKQRPLVREAARERMDTLFMLAFKMAREGDLALSKRYIGLARKVGMRYTVRMPPDMKRATCKGCDLPLIPDLTGRWRNHSGRTVITCLHCGAVKRYPFGKRDDENDIEQRAQKEGNDDQGDPPGR